MTDPALSNPALIEGVISKRGVALSVDGVMLFLIGLFLAVFVGVFGLLTFTLGWGLYGLMPAVPFCFYFFTVARSGRTPGQGFAGLKLRRIDDLGPPTTLQALIWTLGLLFTLACSGGILLLVALVSDHKRTLHDMASGLVMVRTDALPRPPFDVEINAGIYR